MLGNENRLSCRLFNLYHDGLLIYRYFELDNNQRPIQEKPVNITTDFMDHLEQASSGSRSLAVESTIWSNVCSELIEHTFHPHAKLAMLCLVGGHPESYIEKC